MSDHDRTMIRRRPLVVAKVPVQVAPSWLRAAATLVDLVPVLTGFALLAGATGLISIDDWPESRWNWIDATIDVLNQQPERFALPLAAFIGLWCGYHFILELFFGETPGKRVLGLAVVDVHGYRPEAIAVVLRNIFRLLGVLLLGSGWLWHFFSMERRTAHDLLSGTWLVRRSDRVPRSRHRPTPT